MSEISPHKSSQSRRRAFGMGLLLIGIAILLVARVDWTPTESLLADAQAQLLRGQYMEAEQTARRLTQRRSHAVEGWLLAAEAAARQKHFTDASGHLDHIPDDGSRLCAAGWLARGLLELQGFRRLAEAEAAFQKVVQYEPRNVDALRQLAKVLSLQGRHSDALPHRLSLLELNQIDEPILVLLALGDTANDDPEQMREFAAAAPDDAGSLCGLARLALIENRNADATVLLQRLCSLRADWIEPRFWLGSVWLSAGDLVAFDRWAESLPESAQRYSEFWFLRGRRVSLDKQHDLAGRCWAHAVRLDPNSLAANYQLGQALVGRGSVMAAQPFLERSKLLTEYLGVTKSYLISRRFDLLSPAAELAERLGLLREAMAWHEWLSANWQQRPETRNAAARHRQHAIRLRAKLGECPLGQRTAVPAIESLWAHLPPDWKRPPDATPKTGSLPTQVATRRQNFSAKFRDRAEELGLSFRYHNGSRPETKSEFMYEFSGGGVAALDYDLDGWVDVYLTQGCDWPPDPAQRKLLDRLFRNKSGGGFTDVTEAAGLIEPGFSQGVTVGDYDNDGFPDVYVANIGPNRLFRNNGDGTFADVTDETGTECGLWSTSCAIADFNNDGLPDLYVANYVAGEHLFDRPCRLPNGSTRLCTPHEYAAAQDQLFLNLGDGRFREITRESGIVAPDGKGLGLVVADFEGTGWLNVFVANDAVPNFYFVNETRAPGTVPRFSERGFVSGLAVDQDGHAEACMGVAAGDADGDGRLDLFVTNFHRESNTLYLQRAAGLFVDATRAAALQEPSLAMLGFGTQFLDVDLDGTRDLIVTNGHVGDLSQHGIPYRMPAQLFRNLGAARFEELIADRAGPFFQKEWLGRGLARLDWNRDGREDFVVSHLEDGAALVVNELAPPGHFLSVELRGTMLDRDALGATVRVRAGSHSWMQQLTGGDGYQASNERRLIFGLGSCETVDELAVTWRSGQVTRTQAIPANTEWLIREDGVFALRRRADP